LEEISDSLAAAVMIPVTKDTAARDKEDNIVETEEELGIFQLLDRLEEVTSRLTNR
jgi:predicted transcriptional regulator YheO